jgi:CO/xanthine dehydrogenase FAD-binding subunit
VIARAGRLELLRPKTLREALTMLRDEERLVPLAGGTDLYVGLNAGSEQRTRFIDLWPLDELRGIEKDGHGKRTTLSFGALTTYTECLESRAVRKHLPILGACAREIGGVQIQNRGTLAGNIGNGSPAGDSLPVLMAAEARVVLKSRSGGEREVPLAQFYTGYRQSVRRADELIVRIEARVPRGRQLFRKVGPRAAQAISKVVMAAIGRRVALGAVAPVVMRLHKIEAYVEGGGRDRATAEQLLAEEITPIDDVRSTAAYRRRVAANLIGSWIEKLDEKRPD